MANYYSTEDPTGELYMKDMIVRNLKKNYNIELEGIARPYAIVEGKRVYLPLTTKVSAESLKEFIKRLQIEKKPEEIFRNLTKPTYSKEGTGLERIVAKVAVNGAIILFSISLLVLLSSRANLITGLVIIEDISSASLNIGIIISLMIILGLIAYKYKKVFVFYCQF